MKRNGIFLPADLFVELQTHTRFSVVRWMVEPTLSVKKPFKISMCMLITLKYKERRATINSEMVKDPKVTYVAQSEVVFSGIKAICLKWVGEYFNILLPT